jgi:hypothetical protein
MADRRTDQSTGTAPGGAKGTVTRAPTAQETPREQARPPISERVSAAVTSAGPVAPPSAAGTGTTAPRPPQAARKTGRTRKARLRLVHLDPWSVMKTSFLLSIAFGIVTVVAVAVVWTVLGAAGVWESINSTVVDVVGTDSASNWDIEDYLGMSRVMGFTMVVAVVDVVLITVISTLTAFLYNLAASLLGGLEMIWAEDDRR